MLIRLLIVAFLLAASPAYAKDLFLPSSLTDDEIISWLPTDIETLVVAKNPPPLPEDEDKAEKENKNLPDLRWDAPYGFSGHKPKETVLLAVEGSKNFQVPNGNECSMGEECYILVMKEGPIARYQAPVKYRYKYKGISVDVKSTTHGSDDIELFEASPRKNILVMTTSKEYMQTVLTRMSKRHKDRAMPPDLPEWKYVSRDSVFYVIRHFAKQSDDPMSPYCKDTLWERDKIRDRRAIGFVVAAPNYRPSPVKLWYLSNSSTGIKILQRLIHNGTGPLYSKCDQVAQNCWELQFNLPTQNDWMDFTIHLIALEGHTPYF